MKEVLFRRILKPARHIKSLAMASVSEDKDSKTKIRKSFVYHVTHVDEVEKDAPAPQIHITKIFDSKNKIEKFHLVVKGSFFMTHNRFLVKVRFRHTLRIQIFWKTKDFSPKKSVALT